MILADTSIWVDFLRGVRPDMEPLLASGQVVMHPFVVAEIALGSLKNRQRTFALMEAQRQVLVASLAEVRRMVEAHRLYSRGIGLTDAHLLASCLLTPGVELWTRDANLKRAAELLGVCAALP